MPGKQPPYLSATEARREASVLTERIAGEPDARARRKLGRRLAFVATSIAVRDAREDPALVEVGIAAVGTARRCGGATDDLRRVQALLVRAKLALDGVDEPHVLAQRRARIVVETGCVCCCADPGLDPELWCGPAPAVLDAVNRGIFFLVGVGGDGGFDVVLRAVDALEPVLRPQEYRWLEQATEIGVLRVDGPELHFGAPEALRAGARIPVAAGLVKIQVFVLADPRDRRLVAVVCPASDARTDLFEVPQFG